MRFAMLLSLLMACGVDERDYSERRAVAECNTLDTCARGYYEHEYRHHDDCIHERTDDIEDQIDRWYDRCHYDPQEARRCISRIRSLSCADWARGDADRACDLVFDCTR